MELRTRLPLLPVLALLAAPGWAQWSTENLFGARYQLCSTTVGGRAMFAGGFAAPNIGSYAVDIYDATTDTWSLQTLSSARAWLAAATVGDKAVFAGGTNAGLLT